MRPPLEHVDEEFSVFGLGESRLTPDDLPVESTAAVLEEVIPSLRPMQNRGLLVQRSQLVGNGVLRVNLLLVLHVHKVSSEEFDASWLILIEVSLHLTEVVEDIPGVLVLNVLHFNLFVLHWPVKLLWCFIRPQQLFIHSRLLLTVNGQPSFVHLRSHDLVCGLVKQVVLSSILDQRSGVAVLELQTRVLLVRLVAAEQSVDLDIVRILVLHIFILIIVSLRHLNRSLLVIEVSNLPLIVLFKLSLLIVTL